MNSRRAEDQKASQYINENSLVLRRIVALFGWVEYQNNPMETRLHFERQKAESARL